MTLASKKSKISVVKAAKLTKNLKQAALDNFEAINEQLLNPIGDEVGREFKSFINPAFGSRPQEMAKEDLRRAREEKQLEVDVQNDVEKSSVAANQVSIMLNEYKSHPSTNGTEQKVLDEEFIKLTQEVAKLSEAAGNETNAHLETAPKKVSILDIKRLRSIVKELTAKIEESKKAQEMVSQRSNAKRTTGMQAWVSGKQMKIHEQGTLQLQG